MIKVELIDVLILLFIMYLTYITFSLEKPKTKVQEIKDKINDIKKENILTKKPENEFLLDDVEDLIEKPDEPPNIQKPNKNTTTTKPYVEVKNQDSAENINMIIQADNLNTIQKLN